MAHLAVRDRVVRAEREGGEAMDLQAVTKNASSAMSVGVLMEVTELMGNW